MDEAKLPPGIPDSIPFDRIQTLLNELGLPVDELAGFRVYGYGIVAEYYSTDEKGNRWLLDGNGAVAVHRVVIRIDRDTPNNYFAQRPNIHDDGPKEAR